MVKSYLRYIPESSYGVLLTSSFQNGVQLLEKGLTLEKDFSSKRYAASISGERIIILDLKTGVIVKTLLVEVIGRFYSGEGIPSIVHYVTIIRKHPKKPHIIAAGYSDGSVRVWDVISKSVIHTFHGHSKNITALKFCRSGNYLSSGSFDTEITLWDTLSGKGLCRLSGHLNEITDIEFIHKIKFWNQEKNDNENLNIILEETPHMIVTSSKDSTVKIWDIQSQICLQTLTRHKGEIYSILLNPLCNRLFTAGSMGEISIYRLNYHITGLPKNSSLPNDSLIEKYEIFSQILDEDFKLATYYGSIPRPQGGKSTKIMKLIPKWSNLSELSPLELEDDYKGIIFAFTNLNSIESFAYLGFDQTNKRIKKLLRKKSKELNFESQDSKILPGNYEVLPLTKNLLIQEEEMIGTRLLGIDFDCTNNHFILGLGNNSIKYVSLTEDYLRGINSKFGNKEHKIENQDSNESIEDYKQEYACKVVRRIENEGHRGIPRAIDISQDDKFIVTFGDDTIKIWNMKGFRCVRTMVAENPVCGFIAPGGDYTISGTKQGSIQLHDIANCKLIQSLDNAHENSVQSLALNPDNVTFASVAQDKRLNLYSFGVEEVIKNKKVIENRVTITLNKTLPLLEEGIAIKYTPNGKFLILSLLDNTVLVLYADTLKQFLTFYGHSLPVACLDVSHDNTILATGSADKTIKIWGLDFGNIQRSFHAHSECLTNVSFIRDSHYLISTARDGSLKLWDIDKGDLITILHQKSTYGQVPIVSLAHTFDSDRIICGFLDRTIRVWFRTDQQLFLEEEREKEQEEQLEREILQGNNNDYIENNNAVIKSRPTRKTFESLKSTEKLMEIIDVAYNYYIELVKYYSISKKFEKDTNFDFTNSKLKNSDKLQELKNIPPPHSPLEIGELSLQEYVLTSIQRISPNFLVEVVWSLPLLYAEKLLILVETVLKIIYEQSIVSKSKINSNSVSSSFFGLESLIRVVLCLIQTHFVHWISCMNTVTPIIEHKNSNNYTQDLSETSDPRNDRLPKYNIRSILSNLRKYIQYLIKNQMEIISLNNGILKILQQDALDNSSSNFDANFSENNKNKQAKRRKILK